MRGTIHTGNTRKMQITAACPPEEAMAAMQCEVLYLRQELEFIKKIIKTDSTGGRKQ